MMRSARSADAFLAFCKDKDLSPHTMRPYRQIVRELKERWPDWRAMDVDYDELEDHRDELVEAGLPGSTLNERRAVLWCTFRRLRGLQRRGGVNARTGCRLRCHRHSLHRQRRQLPTNQRRA